MRQRLFILMLACLSAAGWAAGKEYLNARAGSEGISVTGVADHNGWLGVSVYSPNSKVKAFHMVRYVHQGTLAEVFPVSREYLNGSFEVALWEKRVPQSSCGSSPCSWCKVNGFHMNGMRSYTSGTVVASR